MASGVRTASPRCLPSGRLSKAATRHRPEAQPSSRYFGQVAASVCVLSASCLDRRDHLIERALTRIRRCGTAHRGRTPAARSCA